MPDADSNLAIAGAPAACASCSELLCLRKQVINLALGNTEQMFCLTCLAGQSETTPETLLKETRAYLLGRECFKKEWIKYETVDYCPDREHCLPSICFQSP